MTLHKELNKPSVNKSCDQSINPVDLQAIWKAYNNDFQNDNNSIISKLFYGTSYSKTFCQNPRCQSIFHNFETFNFLCFPLEEVRKYKNSNINVVSLEDCFNYYMKQDIICGYYCNKCYQNINAINYTSIYNPPNIMIIILNRGKGIQYDIKCQFRTDLIIQKIVNPQNGQMGIVKYQLISVVTHMGSSGMSGHFISYCLNPLNNKWEKFNDDQEVQDVKDFYQEVVNYAMPYILFYHITE